MIIGIVVLWAGYTVALWGYTTVRGYCIGFQDLLNYRYPQSMAGSGTTAAATTAAASSPASSASPAASGSAIKFV